MLRGVTIGRGVKFLRPSAGSFALVVALAAVATGMLATRAPGDGGKRHLDRSETGAPLDLLGSRLSQDGLRLRLSISMRPGWSARDLALHRSNPNSHLCLKLTQRRRRGTLCVVRRARRRGLALARPRGERLRLIPGAKVRRMGPGAVRASVALARVGLRPGRLRWRLTSRWVAPPCDETPGGCLDRLPGHKALRLWLHQPVAVACRNRGPDLISSGPRNRRRVALTFDDGPSTYTPKVAAILRRFDAEATFFQVGSLITSRSRKLERRLVRDGNELADHTQRHNQYPSYRDIAAAKRAIRRASGFNPCLFRPPGGAINRAVIRAAADNGMKTVLWSVDPHDWKLPGTGAIVSNVLRNARPGSIILLHDGGGPRSQTVAALPEILRGLKRRNLKPVTMTKLLRGRFRYR